MAAATYTAEDIAKYFQASLVMLALGEDKRLLPCILRHGPDHANQLHARVVGAAIGPSVQLLDTYDLGRRDEWSDFLENEVVVPRIHCYIDTGTAAYFLTRVGTRQTDKGINSKALRIVDPVGAVDDGPHSIYNGISAAAVAATGQKYPSFKEAVARVESGAPAAAFSTDWCVYEQEGRVTLGYRGHVVGVINDNKRPVLPPSAVQLQESLFEAM